MCTSKSDHLSEDQIALFAEAMQKNDFSLLEKQVRKHVRECDKCATEILAVQDLLEMETPQIEHDPVKPNKKESSRFFQFSSPLFKIAASIICIAGVVYLFEPHWKGEKKLLVNEEATIDSINNRSHLTDVKSKEVIQLVPATAQNNQAEKLLLADNFQKHDGLEILADRFLQGNQRGNEIRILSPSILEIKTKEPIHLEWENFDEEELGLEILNNQGKVILEESLSSNSISIQKVFPEGLYYWKLFNEDYDLIFCGRIKIQ